MIIPPSQLPENAQRWGQGVQDLRESTRDTLSALEGDITTRFTSLETSLAILGNQVDTLEQYVDMIVTPQINRSIVNGWSVPPLVWTTITSVVVPVPPGASVASVYAIATAQADDPGNNVGSPIGSRLRIGSATGPENKPITRGSAGSELWGYTTSFTVEIDVAALSSLTVYLDIINGNAFAPPGSQATLAAITSFA